MPCDSGAGAADLWAMAAELERQFAGYKQRLAERTTTAGATTTTAREHGVDDADAGGDGGAEEGDDDDEAGGHGPGDGGSGDVKGRMHEAYVRRRDERMRDGWRWRVRMERKEAEVKALWARLELAAGRSGAGGGGGGGCAERSAPAAGDPTTTTATTTTEDGDDKRKTERNDDDRRRSASDAALAPRRITSKKHARTRSFSSSTTTSRNRNDVGRRRALSHEPPPSEPDASSGEANKESPGGAAATTTATTRPRTSLRRRNSSVKGHGSAKPAVGPKLPRSLPRRPSSSSGGTEDLGRSVAPAVVHPCADAVASTVPSHSTESAVPCGSGTPRASPPRMSFAGRDDDSSGGTGAANARRATSPQPDRGAVDEAVPHGEPETKDAGVEEHGEEMVADGDITSDLDPEPSYVYVNKDAAEEERAMAALSEPSKLAGSGATLDPDVKESEETPAAPALAEVTAAATEIATTNTEEAPARESSDESSLSVRLSVPSAERPSCSSRDQSIERLLEADAALVRKKREERAEKSAALAPSPRTPPGSRFSGMAARSPRETTVRGFKRFLSFGKKHRGREATVIDCTSPSVPSPADDDSGSASGSWQPASVSIKPRMGSSDAASDDMDHAYLVSPQAACSLQSLVAASPAKSELAEIVPQEKSPKVHRSFFSFRSLNCGRG